MDEYIRNEFNKYEKYTKLIWDKINYANNTGNRVKAFLEKHNVWIIFFVLSLVFIIVLLFLIITFIYKANKHCIITFMSLLLLVSAIKYLSMYFGIIVF